MSTNLTTAACRQQVIKDLTEGACLFFIDAMAINIGGIRMFKVQPGKLFSFTLYDSTGLLL